jgi:peptide deformylase
VRIKADGFVARAFLHEIDHLNGVLYVDIAEENTVMTVEAYNELVQAQSEEAEGESAEHTPAPV